MEDQGNKESRRVGRYLLDGKVGHGGMGRVYRARAIGVAGIVKELCIKQIHHKRLGPAATRRFIEEARTSMRLAHGNIVSVFDFGRAGDEYYLAMEWVDGIDLSALRRNGADPLPIEVAAWIVAGVARALEYAHALGTVHRDVKPANVLISRAGDVKLTDFGVAGILGDEAAGIGGTPGYMAPEQRAGAVPDPRSDLYSLGVLFLELLTGHPLDVEPSEASDALSGPLRSLVSRLVSPEAENRPQDAKDVATELETFVASAQAAGSGAPRDRLAERVAGASPTPLRDDSSLELPVDASYLRDGDAHEFGTMMTATDAPSEADKPNEPEKRRAALRPRLAVLLASAAIGTVVLGLWSMRSPRGEESGAQQAAPAPTRATDVDVPHSPSALATPRPVDPAAPRAADQATLTRHEPGRESTKRPPPAPTTAPTRAGSRTPNPADLRRDRPRSTALRGTLNINAIPWAEVELDGRRLGTTPLFDVSVPVGDHQLTLVNPELQVEQRRSIRVEQDTAQNIVVPLQ